MKEFRQDYYDREYFADLKGKEFRRSNGTVDRWGYKNPSGLWSGTKPIAEAWKTIFEPKNLLDIGCGRGSFVASAREVGIQAYGFDFSDYAVNEGRVDGCKAEWLKVHDATKPWPYNSEDYDLVVALDFLEHIYEDDLPFVIEEMYRVTKKWLFLEIATVDGFREKGYKLKKGEVIPWDDGRTWAGHCTVLTEPEWYDLLDTDGWMPRRDMVNWFSSLVGQSILQNWLLNTMIVLERM
jgi:hypothetical protein